MGLEAIFGSWSRVVVDLRYRRESGVACRDRPEFLR